MMNAGRPRLKRCPQMTQISQIKTRLDFSSLSVKSVSSVDNRVAFTLLEVLLATAIGVVLMAALYTAMSVQLRQARAARDIVEQGNLVRALMARIGTDINANVGPMNIVADAATAGPSTTSSSSSNSSSSGGTTSPATSSSSNSSSNTGTSGNTNNTSTSNSGQGSTPGNQVTFNLGVQGDATHLNLYVSRVPREAMAAFDANPDPTNTTGFSDLRRISYWLVDGVGLARQEFLQVTSDDEFNLVPPNVPNEASYVIAEEVKSVTFSYFDGQAWQDTWDGTEVGSDLQTPIGPPVAIAITLGLALPGSPDVKNYRHVVYIPAANGIGMTPAQAGTGPM